MALKKKTLMEIFDDTPKTKSPTKGKPVKTPPRTNRNAPERGSDSDQGVTPTPSTDPVETLPSLLSLRNSLQTVSQMRAAQKIYFRTRKPDDLVKADGLEAAVDIRLGMLGVDPIV